jgi:hypothetical protein
MRKILFFALFLLPMATLMAQPEVCRRKYSQKLEEGIGLYNGGKYEEAARSFNSAHCEALTLVQHEGLNEWAKKCKDGINARRKTGSGAGKSGSGKAGSTAATKKPAGKPKVDILYTGYMKATCNGDVRGAELELLITAENIKGNKLRLCCFIAPINGSGKVNKASPLASAYTLEGGLSGVEKEVTFAEDEACTSVTVFVPFGVMDFAGDYTTQMMKADMYIYQKGEKKPMAEDHEVYEGLSPHTISFGGRIDNYDLEVGYLGGLLGAVPAVCKGNNVIWENLPYWIKQDEVGDIHVTENSSSSPRTATLHVSSTGGGNVVNVNIRQKGKTADDHATASVKDVWKDEMMRDAARNIKQLNIHVEFEISGARGKDISVYVKFYCPDGRTPLVNDKGERVEASWTEHCRYTETYFDDFPVSMWLNDVTKAANNKAHEAIYYIQISIDEGQTWLTQSGPYTIKW